VIIASRIAVTTEIDMTNVAPRPTSTRDRILEAAAQVFAERGYHATRMDDIEAAANVQRGALYYHIGSKEELLYDLVVAHIDDAYKRGRRAIDKSTDARTQFRDLARAHIATLADRRAEVILSERERFTLTGERGRRLTAKRRKYQDLFNEVIRRGHKQGVFADASEVEVMGLIGLFSYTYVWLRPTGGEGVMTVADRLIDLVLDGLIVRALPRDPKPL
jgi:TetR/AcrR family transcriptional regulator, cholesterol catabolism regulator